jgi:hypothetical protein
MQFVRTSLLWLNSVRRHWGSLVTSGAIIGGLGIWQGSGHYVRPSVYWIIGTVGLVAASYRAWLEEHDAKLKAESENDLKAQQERTKARRKQQAELLTQYIEQGQTLIQRCRSQNELVSEADATKWATEAEHVIAEVFDSTYISRFRSGVGIPLSAAHWPNLENRHVDGFVYARVYRLQCFVDELQAK